MPHDCVLEWNVFVNYKIHMMKVATDHVSIASAFNTIEQQKHVVA